MERKILLAEHERFETERLILRKIEFSDASDLYECTGDEETTRYLHFSAHQNLLETQKMIADYFLSRRLELWAIAEKATGRLIGTIQLHLEEDKGSFAWMVNRKLWGQGIVAEAANCLVKFAFDTLELNVLTADHYVANPNSGKVMEKIGMKKIGQLWAYSKKEEKSVLLDYWAMTKEEYQAR